jgi:hypothetical protein
MLCALSPLELCVASKDNEYNNEILQALLRSAESNFITTDYICKFLKCKPPCYVKGGFYVNHLMLWLDESLVSK